MKAYEFFHRCITGSYDRTARIWDLENCKELASLNGHSNVVFSVCFNGKRYLNIKCLFRVNYYRNNTTLLVIKFLRDRSINRAKFGMQ